MNKQYISPDTATAGELDAVLATIDRLDPDHDLERLMDTCHVIGVRLHKWLHSFDKVSKVVFSKALAAGFEPAGLLTPIKKAMLNGFNEHVNHHNIERIEP